MLFKLLILSTVLLRAAAGAEQNYAEELTVSTVQGNNRSWFYNASNPKKFVNSERRLINFLTADYDKRVRPVYDPGTAIKVQFGFSLSQIIDVDEKNQIITTNSWLNMNWLDIHLQWDPGDFGNISTIHLPYQSIWLPDIILYNNAETAYNLATLSTNAIVQNDGNVSWLSTNIFESACIIDVKYFPFDTQFCNMDFGSWTFSDRELDINFTTEQMDATNYLPSTEWVLKNVTARRWTKNYSCCPDVLFPLVTYQIILQRKPFFYVFNMLLPCIIITYVALLGFSVPADSGEKVTMGITTLLSMTVFLMLVAEQLPPNSKSLPMIGIYYGVAISIVSFATGCTVLTLNVYSMGKKGSPLPYWAKRLVFGVIARLVFKKVCLLTHVDDSMASDTAAAFGHGHKIVHDHTDYTSPLIRPANTARSSFPGHPHQLNCVGGGVGGGGVGGIRKLTKSMSKKVTTSFGGEVGEVAANHVDAMSPCSAVANPLMGEESPTRVSALSDCLLQQQQLKQQKLLSPTPPPPPPPPPPPTLGSTTTRHRSLSGGAKLLHSIKLGWNHSRSNKYNESFREANDTPLLSSNRHQNQQTSLHQQQLPAAPFWRQAVYQKQQQQNQQESSRQTALHEANSQHHGGPAAGVCTSDTERHLVSVLHTVKQTLDRQEKRICQQLNRDQLVREWHEASEVLDRLFLILFILLTSLVTWSMIMRAYTVEVTEPPNPDDI